MSFVVCMRDGAENAVLCSTLQDWTGLVCADIQIMTWAPEQGPLPASVSVLFWDLDGGLPLPPVNISGEKAPPALLLCSSDPGRAIDCYPLHPAAFLKKPIGLDALWLAMGRCVDSWWSTLERLDLLCGGIRRQIPLYDLIWAQSGQRGCLIHTSQEDIQVHQPLRELETSLPARIFLRCHRGFLVNLCHTRAIEGQFLHMKDGAKIPIGRGNRSAALAAYNRLRLTRSGGPWRE